MAKKKGMNLLPLVYGIFGAYLLNRAIGVFAVPDFVLKFDGWIISFAGVLLFIAMYRSVIYSKSRVLKRAIRHANKAK